MKVADRRIMVGSESFLPEGVRRRVKTRDVDIIIIRREGRLFAFDNQCPHQRFAALHEGSLEGHHLTCPMHGWTFDIRTGKSITGEGCLRARVVSVQDGVVWVSLT